MNKCYTLLSCCLLLVLPGFSQSFQRLNVDVTQNETVLSNAFVGGLNSPQWNNVDLNNDGTQDLLIFDRVGDVLIPMLKSGAADEPTFTYAPEFIDNFPTLTNWVLLRDYDDDGIQDIFAYSDVPGIDGVMVYQGYIEGGEIAFRRVTFDTEFDIIYFPLQNNSITQLLVTKIDYPAVDDMDCDGDLDILTFNIAGGFVELYKNQSVEQGYGLDSLIYELEEDCWGGFFESGITEEVDLSDVFGECFDGLVAGDEGDIPISTRHAGSTLLTFDADNDGDRELILGDLSFTNLTLLTNNGSCETAWINQQDVNFPSNSFSTNIPIFPGAFMLDVNNDGNKDLIASPNPKNNAENFECAWMYENITDNLNPTFEYRRNNFIVGEMIDLGSGAHPVLVDYNADGLLDLVVGNFSFFQPFGERDARLYLYENIGTAEQPAFELIDDDYLGLNQFSQNSYTFVPAFGDLDNDGDLDIVVGEEFGQLFYAENVAGPNNPFEFSTWQYGYMGIDVGIASKPQIVDLNRDNRPDLVIGEQNGNINFIQNIGSPTEPFFEPDEEVLPNTFFLGEVDTRILGFTTGHSTPFFMDFPEGFRLFTGTETGRIEVYDNVDDNLYGAFDLMTETFGELDEGTKTSVAIADLDNDGLLEMMVGNFRGGLSYFQTPLTTSGVSSTYVAPVLDVQIFPNPAKDFILLESTAAIQNNTQVQLMDMAGRSLQQLIWNGDRMEINVSDLPAGIYLVQIQSALATVTKKIVVE